MRTHSLGVKAAHSGPDWKRPEKVNEVWKGSIWSFLIRSPLLQRGLLICLSTLLVLMVVSTLQGQQSSSIFWWTGSKVPDGTSGGESSGTAISAKTQEVEVGATGSPSLMPITSRATALKRIEGIRVSQMEKGQYNSDAEHQRWSPSTCSAAAITMVLKAYAMKTGNGQTFRISDVLAHEIALGVITPEQGLVHPQGIEQTFARFQFAAQRLPSPDLNRVIQLANQGYLQVVNLPPATWPGGHFLLLVGGNAQEVYTADSSKLNLTVWTRANFLKYWRGWSLLAVPKQLSILRSPTLDAKRIDQILQHYGSPAAGTGEALFSLGKQAGIDPAYALAFFQVESQFGKQGIARTSKSLGNIRCTESRDCITPSGQRYRCTAAPCATGYRWYANWEDSYKDWFDLIGSDLYRGSGLLTVDLIIPRYAPGQDNNDEKSYIASVQQAVIRWQQGQ